MRRLYLDNCYTSSIHISIIYYHRGLRLNITVCPDAGEILKELIGYRYIQNFTCFIFGTNNQIAGFPMTRQIVGKCTNSLPELIGIIN